MKRLVLGLGVALAAVMAGGVEAQSTPPGYYCYQPPMPTCRPGAVCAQVMPQRVCQQIHTTTPTPVRNYCTNFWWFDDTHLTCSQKMFCGNYVYAGLKNYISSAACDAALALKKSGGDCLDINSVHKWTYDSSHMTCTLKRFCNNNAADLPAKTFNTGDLCRADLEKGNTISAWTRCTGEPKILQDLTVTNNIQSNKNIWEEVWDLKTGRRVIISKTAGSDVSGAVDRQAISIGATDFAFKSILRGVGYTESLPIVNDGRTYLIRAYDATNSEGIPVFERKLAEWDFGPTGCSSDVSLKKCMADSDCSEGEACDGYCLNKRDVSVKCGVCPNGTTKLAGDVDCSGTVDMNDYEIWRREYLRPVSTVALPTGVLMSDLNCDGKVDFKDFKLWKTNKK